MAWTRVAWLVGGCVASDVQLWDLDGGMALPPRSYLESQAAPVVLRRLCLRRDGACDGNGTALTAEEVSSLPLEDVLYSDDGDEPLVYTYSDGDKPLAGVKSLWERAAARGGRWASATGGAILSSEAASCYASSPAASRAAAHLNGTLRLDALGDGANVWVGRFSTAAAHYDASTNVFLVVHGAKTFLVAPPGAVGDEHSYLHPEFRRSPSLAALDFASIEGLAGWRRVDLRTGDALVLPAYWWHHVATPRATVSVAVNAWSRPRRFAAVKALVAAEAESVLPFQGTWPTSDKIAVLERLLATLASRALRLDDARPWLRAKLAARLGDLPRRFPKLVAGAVARHCAPGNRLARRDRAHQLWDAAAIEPRLDRAVRVLRGVADDAILELEVANAVEAVAYAALSAGDGASARTAVAFLVSCFDSGDDDGPPPPAAAEVCEEPHLP